MIENFRSCGDDLGPGTRRKAEGAPGELPGHVEVSRHPETHRQCRGPEEARRFQKRLWSGWLKMNAWMESDSECFVR